MFKSALSLTLAAALGTAAFGQTTVTAVPGEAAASKYASISQEILRAIEKGNEYLKSKQNPEGYWAQPSYPALTALAVTAYMRDPANQGKPIPEYIRKGYDFVLKSQKEDGSIFNRGMSSYNTAVCMMALLAANKEEYAPAILKGRAYLIKQQNHFAPDNPYNGGIGYGDKRPLPLRTFPTPPWPWKPFTTPRSSPRTANTGNSRTWTGTPPRNSSTAASRTQPSTRNPGSPVTNPSSAASCTARASPAPGTAKAPRLTRRNRPGPTAA